MFPFKSCLRRLFLFPPICLEWEFACSPVACTRLKELPSWTCSRGEWRSADVVSYMFDVTQQRALSLEELSLRNSNTSTVTNLECLVSFRLCWLSLPSLSLRLCSRQSKKLPGGGSERERLQELISVRGQAFEWVAASAGLHPPSLLPVWTHLDHPSKCVPKHDYKSQKVAATLKTTIDYVCFHCRSWEITWSQQRRLVGDSPCKSMWFSSSPQRRKPTWGLTISAQSAVLATERDRSATCMLICIIT